MRHLLGTTLSTNGGENRYYVLGPVMKREKKEPGSCVDGQTGLVHGWCVLWSVLFWGRVVCMAFNCTVFGQTNFVTVYRQCFFVRLFFVFVLVFPVSAAC